MTRYLLAFVACCFLAQVSCSRRGPQVLAAAPHAAVQSVTFGGPGFHSVELDGYGLARAPHWTHAGRPLRDANPLLSAEVPRHYQDHGCPVAYKAGCTVEVSAEFRVETDSRDALEVRGTASAFGLEFYGSGKPVKGILRTDGMRAAAVLPDHVTASRLDIDWTVAGRPAGRSSSSLYVLAGTPTGALIHTPLDLSCRAADRLKNRQDIIDHVWAEFTDCKVTRVRDGEVLKYWAHPENNPANTRGMLVAGFGNCVAWAEMFYRALSAHGIDCDVLMVHPNPAKGRLYLKSYKFLEGNKFVTAGRDGVCQTRTSGDDETILKIGQSRTQWVREAGPLTAPFEGDDGPGRSSIGSNGRVETRVDPALAHSLIPLGFGYPMQRGYRLAGEDTIRLGGDDVIATHGNNTRWVLTGANGILETEPQPGLTGKTPVGNGVVDMYVTFAVMRATGPKEKAVPFALAIGPGPDGILTTKPAGDDTLEETATYLAAFGAEFGYVNGLNAWPEGRISAQGVEDSPPDFPSHNVVRIGDRIYDPSYGKGPFATYAEFEAATFGASGTQVRDDKGQFVLRNDRIAFAVKRHHLTGFSKLIRPD